MTFGRPMGKQKRRDGFLTEAYCALEAFQERTGETLAEALGGMDGYRDEEEIDALSTLLYRIQTELEL